MKLINMAMGATIAIILLGALFVPILSAYTPDTYELGWCYDDYEPAVNVESVTGALELVTIDGTEYLHANAVGDATITYEDGNVESLEVSKAPLDLIFMYGQSNAAYRNADPTTASPVPELGTAYYYGLEDRSGPTAAENNTGMDLDDCAFWTMLDSDGDLRIGDKAPAFSATYNNITGHKVYWVCGAIGNKAMSTFLPTSGFMWTYGQSVLTAAIALVDTDLFDLNVSYYLWVQGEANATSAVSSYKSQFLTMHEAMLDGDMGVAFDGCFISIVREENGGNAATAQRELCEEYSTIHLGADIADTFTVANGMMGSDDLHYSQLGNNAIGAALGNSVGDYVVGPLASTAGESIIILYAVPPLAICAIAVAFIPSKRD